MNVLKNLTMSVLACLIIAACGGGGGGGGGGTPPAPLPFSLLSNEPGSSLIEGFGIENAVTTLFDASGNGVSVWIEDAETSNVLRYSAYSAASGNWSPAATALVRGVRTMRVRLAVSGDAFGIVVDAGGSEILAATVSGGVVSDFETLVSMPEEERNASLFLGEARVAAAAGGFVATWQRATSFDRSTFSRTYEQYASVLSMPGAGWSDGVLISDEENSNPLDLIGNDFGAMLTWMVFDSGAATLKMNYYDGSSWQAVPVDFGPVSTSLASVAATNGTDFQIALITADNASLRSVNLSSGFVLSSEVVIGTGTSIREPSIASDGSMYVLAWNRGNNIFASVGAGTTFTPSAQIQGASGSNNTKTLAGENGEYVMVWRQDDRVFATLYDGSWSAAEGISGTNIDLVSELVLGLEDGIYVAAWRQFRADLGSGLYASRLTSSGWQAPVEIDAGTRGVAEITVAATNMGGVVLNWVQQTDDNTRMEVLVARAEVASAAGFGSPLAISGASSGSSVEPLHVVTNEAGLTLAVWEQVAGTKTTTFGAVRSADGVWGTPEVMVETTGFASQGGLVRDRIATNGEGFVYAYTERDPRPDDPFDILVRTYENGSWSVPTMIDVGLPGRIQDYRLASNGTGYGITFARVASTGFADIQAYGSIYDGSSWSLPEVLSDGGLDGVQLTKIASNGIGYAVTWDDYNNEKVMVNVYDGSDWSGPVTLVGDNGFQPRPKVVSDGVGYMLWWQGFSASFNSRIYTAVSPSGAANDFGPVEVLIEDTKGASYRDFAAGGGAGFAVVLEETNFRGGVIEDALAFTWDGMAWSGPVIIDAAEPDVFVRGVVASDDEFAVLYEQRDTLESGQLTSLFASIFDGTGWSAPQGLETSDETLFDGVSVGRPNIAAASDGFGVTWTEAGSDGSYHIQLSTWDGMSWNAQQIESQSTNGDFPVIGANADDSYTVLWRQADPAGSQVVRLPWAYHGLE